MNIVLTPVGVTHPGPHVGASKDETISAKAAIVGEVLRRLRAAGVDTSNPIIVGDRVHDIVGAAEHGIPTVLVEWGYAEPWERPHAMITVGSAVALESILLPS